MQVPPRIGSPLRARFVRQPQPLGPVRAEQPQSQPPRLVREFLPNGLVLRSSPPPPPAGPQGGVPGSSRKKTDYRTEAVNSRHAAAGTLSITPLRLVVSRTRITPLPAEIRKIPLAFVQCAPGRDAVIGLGSRPLASAGAGRARAGSHSG